MDKYKNIEKIIAFKLCVSKKEIVNENFKIEIPAKTILQFDYVHINEIRENFHCIELWYYTINKEGLINQTLYFDGTVSDLIKFLNRQFIEIKLNQL